jgi:predicted ABC-type ATPase
MIASDLSPFSPEIVAIKAGRLMLDEIDTFRKRRVDFAFETTLSGKTYVTLLKEMKALGYEVHIYFLWLRSVDLALERVAERVAAGGHSVPERTVRRRFDRGLHNLFHLYRQLVDSWIIFDNSEEFPRVIAKETAGDLTVYDGTLLDKIQKDVNII